MTTLTTALLALSLAQAPQTLTLEDALKRAGEVNLDLKAAQARVGVAKAGVWKAWSYHLRQSRAGVIDGVAPLRGDLQQVVAPGLPDAGLGHPHPGLGRLEVEVHLTGALQGVL